MQVHFKYMGLCAYEPIWILMKEFTGQRDALTQDEVWLLEHPSVYTLGQAGKKEHIINSQSIEVIQSDRGGQVTYHGPGQLVAYILMDIKRKKLSIRSLVKQLEEVLQKVLSHYYITTHIKCNAPGVYVGDAKIASIGLRVKNGCTYHGIALNVDMDLKPFRGINPCGFNQLEMTQISHFQPNVNMNEVKQNFQRQFINQFY